jgi:type I restriction enzyme, S subunit
LDSRQFLAEFSHIASAPSGVQRVRELLIYLAIHGELNSGGESDRNAAQRLIDDAVELKRKMIDAGETRREQQLPSIPESHTAGYPNTWAITRLGDIVNLVSGRHLSAEQQNRSGVGIPYFTGASDFGHLHPVVTRWTTVEVAIAKRGDFLIAVKGTIGKINVLNLERAALGRQLMAVRALTIDPAFLALILRSNENYFLSKRVGIAIPGISREDILHIVVGIPSRDEQERIVARVNELMTLCDKLEEQQHARDGLRKLTRKAALDNLATAQTSASLIRGWNRVRNGISLWLDDEDAVIELRNAVAFLGCRGLLTESPPLDALESNGTIYPLPAGWEWTTLRKLTDDITSGSRGWRQFMAPHGDIFIRSQDIKHDALVFEDPAFVNLPEKVEGKRTLVRPGDLLVTITGANVGKCAKVPLLPSKAYVSQHVALVRMSDVRHTPFLHWWITNTYGGRMHLYRFIYGDKPGLNLPQVGSIPVPLPPQEVQDRIVAALEHYTATCRRLAEQVKDARNLAGLLATASVAAITGARIEDKEKMKAPKTELVSNLRIGINPANADHAPLTAILITQHGELSAKALWGRSGLEIDAFYQQLKEEMASGWIVQPEIAYMKELETA